MSNMVVVKKKKRVTVCSLLRPTRPAFSRAFGAPPYGTPRPEKVNPDLPRPLDVGGPASGTPWRTPVLDTLLLGP